MISPHTLEESISHVRCSIHLHDFVFQLCCLNRTTSLEIMMRDTKAIVTFSIPGFNRRRRVSLGTGDVPGHVQGLLRASPTSVASNESESAVTHVGSGTGQRHSTVKPNVSMLVQASSDRVRNAAYDGTSSIMSL